MTVKKYHYILPIFLLAAIIFFQGNYLDKRYVGRVILPECPWCDANAKGDVVYLPMDTSAMRLISPADPDFLADMLWMRALYYFGQHALTDQQYPFLLNLLDMITDLSPRWGYPYIHGAIIMSDIGESTEDALYMVEKGLTHHPEDWQLWFFKGYYLMKDGNNLEAAEALQKAAVLPGAPVYLAELSATLLTREGKRDMALRFLEASLEMIADPRQREFIIQKMQKVKGQYDDTGTAME
ncbi:hypothetical protein [Desulfococcus multivorans]|uniref:Uncharacterized protein n=1 Tax=Desulfococcus multivorans DSM 2059 TaxID=1121405 RepID=S7UXY4_DESML|nr:hypothetical protein [Desulfococcus multivorans]AQV01250.1 hypothetical protein B2D07_11045 [Desulfococcus multivorans]EPR39109.1 hypothetical protein dsmv_2765 [Desulfococcus multivorans DSM 2059]SJZ54783.1 hypothetical protein SAMN02745446_00909 [Desulfococcus multivorans DSM 2059]